MHHWKLGTVLALSLGLAACGTTNTPKLTSAYIQPECPVEEPCEGPTPPPEPEVVLSPDTRILDSAVEFYDQATGRLTVTNTYVTASYAVGNIVVGGITTATPVGVPPRRITGITYSGNTIILSTQEAGLTDAVQDGTINFTQTLTVNDIAEETTPDVVASALNGQSLLSALAVNCTTNGNIYSKNFEKTFGANSTLSGCARIGLDTTLNMRISRFTLQSFEASVKISEEAQLELDLASDSGSKEWELGRIRFNPITVFLGPVPIVMTPYIAFAAGVNGNVSANLTYKVEQSASYKTGILYANGSLSKISEKTSFFKGPKPIYSPTLTATAKGYLDVKPGLNFWSTVVLASADGDVTGTVRGYVKADVNTSRNPVWQITAGPQFCIGYKAKLDVLFGIISQSWSGNQCGNELRTFEWNSNEGTGNQYPSPYPSWSSVILNFTNTYGDIEIYRTDPRTGVETMVVRLGGNNTFDITPFIDANDDTNFRIRSISKKPGSFSSYQRKIDMDVLGNNTVLWNTPPVSCSSCGSADVYGFTVNKDLAFFKVLYP